MTKQPSSSAVLVNHTPFFPSSCKNTSLPLRGEALCPRSQRRLSTRPPPPCPCSSCLPSCCTLASPSAKTAAPGYPRTAQNLFSVRYVFRRQLVSTETCQVNIVCQPVESMHSPSSNSQNLSYIIGSSPQGACNESDLIYYHFTFS